MINGFFGMFILLLAKWNEKEVRMFGKFGMILLLINVPSNHFCLIEFGVSFFLRDLLESLHTNE